ncbi:DUF4383 domain-containing protein [Microbacterium sp. JZ31]|uniref:DUF4383 domain-containing protein n=1 Tax=Microbacterium sp. JZ31 TaxID=1906274 RepID=UPI0019348C59|nr:DUF4383 domain-containing protein [Microbacterium sp. JZ31]
MTTANRTNGTYAETPVQKVALIYGIVFLIVGVGGFIPGLTTGIESLQFAGHTSEAMLLGIFQVSILHNIVHILYGVVGLLAARAFGFSRAYLIWGGAVYALLWLYGLFIPHDSAANFVPLNTADNWLHFALAVTMIGLGILLGRGARDALRA